MMISREVYFARLDTLEQTKEDFPFRCIDVHTTKNIKSEIDIPTDINVVKIELNNITIWCFEDLLDIFNFKDKYSQVRYCKGVIDTDYSLNSHHMISSVEKDFDNV